LIRPKQINRSLEEGGSKMSPSVIKVKVTELGGPSEDLVIAEGATLDSALRAANIEMSNVKEVRIGNDIKELSDMPKDGDVIIVVTKITGNR